MRSVVRNSFARQSIRSERVRVDGRTCAECGSVRYGPDDERGFARYRWLYRFHVDDDSGPRHSGPIADGRLFCSRECAETYIGRPFDETR